MRVEAAARLLPSDRNADSARAACRCVRHHAGRCSGIARRSCRDRRVSARRFRWVCGARPAIAGSESPAHVRRIRVPWISRSHRPIHLPPRRRMDAGNVRLSTNARGSDRHSDHRRCRRSGADADRTSARQQGTLEEIPAAVPERPGDRNHHGHRVACARLSRLAIVRARAASDICRARLDRRSAGARRRRARSVRGVCGRDVRRHRRRLRHPHGAPVP